MPEPPDEDDLVEEDDEPKRPAGRKHGTSGSKGSPKKSAKGGSSGGGSNAPLVIGGIVGLFVVMGAGLFFSGIFSKPALIPVAAAPVEAVPVVAPPPVAVVPTGPTPAEKVLGLRWMPANTDLLVHVKVGEIWQAPLLKGPLSDPSLAGGLHMFQNVTGVPPADVETVSVGIVDFIATGIKAIAATPQAAPNVAPRVPPPSAEDIHYILVLKTRKPLDFDSIAKSVPNATLQEKNGKKYFAVPAVPSMSPSVGGWSPDPNTMILATTTELFAAMDRGETVVPRKEFKPIDHTPHLIVGTVIPNFSTEEIQLLESKQNELPMGFVTALKALKEQSLQLAGIGLSVKGGFDLQVFTSSGTADGAKMLKTQFEGFLGIAKSGFETYKKTAPPLLAELGEMLLTNLKIEGKNLTVKLSTSIPDSEQAKLEQLPAIVMMMAMTGGLNGLGGPPAVSAAFAGNKSLGDPSMNNSSAKFALGKQPGETESVDAVKTDGLPDGLKLSAKTAWGPVGSASSEGTASRPVEIFIEATGNGLESICGSGEMSTKTMSLEGGGSLKKVKRTSGTDLTKGLLAFDASDDAAFDHPPQTLRVKLAVEAPAATATRIGVLEGSFKFLTSTDSREFTIDEVPRKVKRVSADPEFKALEIRWHRGAHGTTPESIAILCGKDHFLGQVKGMPGNVVSETETEKEQTVQRLYSNHEGGKFPDDFQIAFKVHPNVKEHTVSFHFENVPLPTAESKPK